MKKFFVILSLFVATTVLAGPVSKEQARQLAADFVKTRPAAAASKAAGNVAQQADALSLVTLSQNRQEAMAAPFYIFNIGERQGFVIISGDDRTAPVLGYSDKAASTLSACPRTCVTGSTATQSSSRLSPRWTTRRLRTA